MSEREQSKETKKGFKLTKNWIIAIVIVLSIVLVGSTIGIVNSVTENPGVKVFKSYMSAARSQNVKKMAGAFYSKKNQTEKYDTFIDNYSQGKEEYQDFIRGKGAQDQELRDFLTTNERLNNTDDLRDHGLRLSWEERLAKSTKRSFEYSILSQDANQVKLRIKLTYTEGFLATNLPGKYSSGVSGNVREVFDLTIKRNPDDNKWYFASDFRLMYGQSIVPTWFAPFDDSGNVEVKRFNPHEITASYKLSKLTENIVSIGDEAFADCDRLEELIIPEGLINIGKDAFRGCTSLKKIVYEDGSHVTLDSNIIIGDGAFRECNELVSFQIPSINEIIPNYVFFNCNSLKNASGMAEYNIPEGTTAIGHYAFYGTQSLEQVLIPETVESIGDGAFQGCTNLRVVGDKDNKLSDNIIRMGTNTFRNCVNLTKISLPKGITDINIGMFQRNLKLSSIGLPENLKSIGNYAFAQTALTKVIIPSTVERIGNNAFNQITTMTSLEFEKDDSSNTTIRTIGENAFYGCTQMVSLELPNSIKGIGNNAFVGCSSLRNVMVNFAYDTVVGETIFATKAGIPKVYVQDDLDIFKRDWYGMALDIYSQDIIQGDFAIMQETLTDAKGITKTENVLVQYLGNQAEVTLDTSITRIGDGAFSNSKTLKEITNFSDLVLTDVGRDVFANCVNMNFDEYGSALAGYLVYLGEWLIDGSGKMVSEKRTGVYNVLDLTDRSKYTQGDQQLPNTIGIAAGAFADAENLVSVKFSKELKYICDQAFIQLIGLTGIEFEKDSQLQRIGNRAFYSCEILDHIILPSTLTEIGDEAFGYCTNLRYVKVNSEDSVLLGVNAFNVSDSVLKLYINKYDSNDYYTTNINWAAYKGDAFDINIIHQSGDYSYKTLSWTDSEGAEHQDETLIQMLSTGLTTFSTPENISRIGAGAFARSQTLEEVNIHANVKRIEQYAFYGCENLFRVVFKAKDGAHSLVYIGTHAFRDTSALSFNQDSLIVFEPTNPTAGFTVGDTPFDTIDLDQKVSVGIRANYEKNAFWKEFRDMLIAADDPTLIIDLQLMQNVLDQHQNIVSPESGEHVRAPGYKQEISATADQDNGYVFVGWFATKDAVEAITSDANHQVEFGEANTSNTYIGRFSRSKAWVRVSINSIVHGGDVYLNNKMMDINSRTDYKAQVLNDCDSSFTLEAKPYVEYDFIGWFNSENELISDQLVYNGSMDYNDVQLEARFKQVRSWTILTQQTGGKVELISEHNEDFIIATDSDIRVLLEPNTAVTFKATADKFYELEGWYEAGELVDGDSESQYTYTMGAVIGPDVLIRPNFVKVKVSLTVQHQAEQGEIFRIDGGQRVAFTQEDISHGTTARFLAEGKPGYKFSHWVLDDKEITDQELEYTITDIQPIEIQAIFEEAENITITIEYNSDFGTVLLGEEVIVSKSILYNDTITLTANPSVGYWFHGWYNAQDKLITDKDELTIKINDDALVEYKAVFRLIEDATITINFDSSRGSVLIGKDDTDYTKAISAKTGDEITLKSKALVDVFFEGWYLGEQLISKELNIVFRVMDTNITLEARFQIKVEVKVEYDSKMGTVFIIKQDQEQGFSQDMLMTGQTIKLKATSLNGYKFVGWYNGEELVQSNVIYEFNVTKAVTLEARFEAVAE